jgi:hypothetical protein
MRIPTHSGAMAFGAAGHRRTVQGPVVDLAQWIGPLALAAVLALFVVATGGFALTRAGVPSSAAATIRVRVSPSDTLWSIASAHRVPGMSTAETIDSIALANGLTDSALAPGDVLVVPSASPAGPVVAQSGVAETVR